MEENVFSLTYFQLNCGVGNQGDRIISKSSQIEVGGKISKNSLISPPPPLQLERGEWVVQNISILPEY